MVRPPGGCVICFWSGWPLGSNLFCSWRGFPISIGNFKQTFSTFIELYQGDRMWVNKKNEHWNKPQADNETVETLTESERIMSSNGSIYFCRRFEQNLPKVALGRGNNISITVIISQIHWVLIMKKSFLVYTLVLELIWNFEKSHKHPVVNKVGFFMQSF